MLKGVTAEPYLAQQAFMFSTKHSHICLLDKVSKQKKPTYLFLLDCMLKIAMYGGRGEDKI